MVYVTTSPNTARLFASDGGWVYEVRPLGELHNDFVDEFFCVAALVLGVHEVDVPVLIEHDLGRPEYRCGLAEQLFWLLLCRVLFREGIHGTEHWQRVLANGLFIALVTPEADPFVIAAFAALHDAYRLEDGNDPEHGSRAAQHARSFGNLGTLSLSLEQLDTLCVALEEHDRGGVTEHPTIGACWDADRLDLPRVGVEVDPSFLSMPAALALNQLRQHTVAALKGAACTT